MSDFINERSWKKLMSENSIDSFSNYIGEDYSDYIVLLSRTRDSDTLAESNFETALSSLGGESEDVIVARFGHWGCGWVESILVKIGSDKIGEAESIYTALQDYPVLDDADFSDREAQEREEFWDFDGHRISELLYSQLKNSGLVKADFDSLSERRLADLNEMAKLAFNESCLFYGEISSPDFEREKSLAGAVFSELDSKNSFFKAIKKLAEMQTRRRA